jgi:prefoldin subunit 5
MDRKPLDPNDIKQQIDDIELEARALAAFIQYIRRADAQLQELAQAVEELQQGNPTPSIHA